MAFDRDSGQIVLYDPWLSDRDFAWNGSDWIVRHAAMPSQGLRSVGADPLRGTLVVRTAGTTHVWDGVRWRTSTVRGRSP